MKKAFYNPEMTIVEFEDENLIATSGDGGGNNGDMDGDWE